MNKVKCALQYVASKLAGMFAAIKRNVSQAACVGSKAMSRYHGLEDDDVTNEKHDHVPGPSHDAFDNVTTQISMIMSIWYAVSGQYMEIRADMRQVGNFLNIEEGSEAHKRQRLSIICETYSFLTEIFREYQVAVANRPPIVRRRRPA
ncbi:hypothetical protein QCA50_013565 [Cerrena zonata]|uniref:Uncharacterized protein n=1 Tax=Cerrena zonata TaxID=2478898 RepID=A0AAW0FNN7_9APHY